MAVAAENIFAREAGQQEFLGGDVSVEADVRGGRQRVGAVETVETRDQKPDAEADVGRVVRAGGDAPVDLLLEGAVHIGAAVIIDDPSDQAGTPGRSGRLGGVGHKGRRRTVPLRGGEDAPGDLVERLPVGRHLLCPGGGQQAEHEAEEQRFLHSFGSL